MAEKKKKDKTEIKLPKAWTSMAHKNATAQAKANFEDIHKVIYFLIGLAIVLFILLGGINQRKLWEVCKNIGTNIGTTIAGWFSKADVEVNDDGVYLTINESGSAIGTDESGNITVSSETEAPSETEGSEAVST